ncbi:M16 family metallopeptidase [Mesoterricola silvestris]|uniref:Peptidase M16 n=1 Tax=Mesoterricola silvestris TaxID=2927979 RepID=A0AA48GEG7_9BACT|nr:pitrilysin family protein [Mesoterricola silvestris]BDU71036.1 peptidase M16 [Mesoterricola silvestris]
MSRFRFDLPLAAILILGGLPAAAKAPASRAVPRPPEKAASVEGITEYRLGNGLKVLLFPDPSKANVTVNITYLVGSRDESYGETGMAHLLEHMIFKGTPKHPDIPGELSLHGADFNGSTSFDRTNYYESMKASEANLKWALELEADRMINSWVAIKPAKAAELLKTEMTVVRNEFESGENQPFSVLMERVMETAYLWHNYGKPTIGCRADIENVNIWHLSAFFRKYYQPDNAVLTVAGRFDPVKTLALINTTFGPIPRPSRKLEPTYTVEPTQDGERSVTVRRVGDVKLAMAAYHMPAATDPDLAPLTVLAKVLGSAPSGRLYKALVEPRKAAQVFCNAEATREPGLFYVGAMVRPEGNLDEARDLVLDTTEAVAATPFGPEEVERAKSAILKQVDLTLNQSDQVGLALSEAIANGDWRTFFLDRDRVKAVTPADVARVAKAYLKSSNRTLGLFVPTPKPERVEIPPMRDVAAMVQDYKGQEVRSQGEAFDVSPASIDRQTVRFTTAAGLKVALVPKKTRGAAVNVALNLHFGTEAALQDLGPRGTLAGAMLLRGTARHTRQELADTLDKLKANVRLGGSAEGVRGTIETVRENLPAVLGLVTEALKEASFPAQEFELLRQQFLAGLESQRSDPQALAGITYRRALNAWPKGHPRYAATLDESIADMKAVKVEDVKALHDAFYGASNGELTIVGDVDPKEARALVESLLGSWKSPAPYKRITNVYRPEPGRSEVIETPDKANAVILGGLNLALKESDPDFAALVLGDYMVGGSTFNSRLGARVRVKEGLSYGVGSQFQAGALDAFGQWTFYAICAPQNAAKAEAAIREELALALASGFTAKELAEAKTGWLQAEEQGRSQDPQLAGMIQRDLEAGRTMAFQADLERRVAALTSDQIVAALKKHLDPARITLVKAGDFQKAAKR